MGSIRRTNEIKRRGGMKKTITLDLFGIVRVIVGIIGLVFTYKTHLFWIILYLIIMDFKMSFTWEFR